MNLLAYLYRENRDYLIISTLLFIGSALIGYFAAGFLDTILGPIVNEFRRSIIEEELKITILSLFSHNYQAILFLYLGGLSLSIFTGIFLSFNGLFMGYFASKVPFFDFILLVAPHGIFEIPGLIIASVAGFRLTSFIIHFIRGLFNGDAESFKMRLKRSFDDNMMELRDSLLIFFIAVILIFIAAIVESEFTLGFYYAMKGLIG